MKGTTKGTPCEAGKLLAWLGEVLKKANGVDVEVVVVDDSGSRSSVHITVHDVPGPLAGFGLRPRSDGQTRWPDDGSSATPRCPPAFGAGSPPHEGFVGAIDEPRSNSLATRAREEPSTN